MSEKICVDNCCVSTNGYVVVLVEFLLTGGIHKVLMYKLEVGFLANVNANSLSLLSFEGGVNEEDVVLHEHLLLLKLLEESMLDYNHFTQSLAPSYSGISYVNILYLGVSCR